MNIRNQAAQAIRYLKSLRDPLPPESDADFYKQNDADYQSLLTLNNKGLGRTVEELQELVDAPLTVGEIKRVVNRLQKIDDLIQTEYDKEESIQQSSKYWNGFFSGFTPTPTNRCQQLLNGIKSRLSKLYEEQSALFQQITIEQATNAGYCCDGMDENDFWVK